MADLDPTNDYTITTGWGGMSYNDTTFTYKGIASMVTDFVYTQTSDRPQWYQYPKSGYLLTYSQNNPMRPELIDAVEASQTQYQAQVAVTKVTQEVENLTKVARAQAQDIATTAANTTQPDPTSGQAPTTTKVAYSSTSTSQSDASGNGFSFGG